MTNRSRKGPVSRPERVVAPITVKRWSLMLTVRALSEQDLTELFYVREALEGMAARLAAENATPSEIAEIRELLEDMETVHRRGDVTALRLRAAVRGASSPARPVDLSACVQKKADDREQSWRPAQRPGER